MSPPTNNHATIWHLETDRMLLRRVTLDDAQLMLSIWNDPAFIRHVGDREIRSIEEAEAALIDGAFLLYEKYGYGPYSMTLKADGRQAGICGLFRRDNLEHPDIGFALLPGFLRQGLAWEAASAVIEHARRDLRIHYLAAIVSPTNLASIALLEKLGLVFDRGITMPGEEQEISLYGMRLG